jgi:Ser/Thr protein kinase RdoA (MazF antagonist)
MLKLKYLFDNRDLALMLLGNWEYDRNNVDILDYFRISASAIYPYKHNGKTFILRFSPLDSKIENELQNEIEFIHYLQKRGLNVLEPVLSKCNNYFLKKDTPWGKYIVCAFKRVDGEELSELEYSDEIVHDLGKTLGRLHKYSMEFTYVNKESCFDKIGWMENYAKNELKDNKELILQKIDEVRSVFQKLPQNESNFGLIHYDFELDNVFYDEISKKYSIIDFGSSMYHWYSMDIEQSLNKLKGEYLENDFEHLKKQFIDGYKTEYQIFESEFNYFPVFRRFDELLVYINLREVVDETWDNEPEWMVNLRYKLNEILIEKEKDIRRKL